MDPLLIIGAVVILASIVLLIVGLSGERSGQELVEKRLGDTQKKRKAEKEKTKRESVIGAAVDRAVAGRGFAQNLATQLARANLKWTVGEFIVMSITLSILAGLLFFVIKRVVLIPVGAIAGFFLPRIYLAQRMNKRLKEFNNQLGDALNLMVNSLRAGYSTMQAMEVISDEMPAPISEEFGRVVMELQLGVPFDTAMANLMRRVPSPDMDLVVTAMSVQREVGGNLAEVLDAISFTIRERIRIKGEIRVMTSQGRMTGYVITLLPFALGAFIYMINPGFMGGMFEDPCGWIMLGVSLVMIGAGYFVINKIVSIEV
ncbi:MAG TPA: type II secretion system F family protein [Anaerolineae bacterium]|nr:type II secretion system F family protein [Anaerolineae bacterium]HQK13999.1 type II secretion system F family protein [Anaerolineae bacterium]